MQRTWLFIILFVSSMGAIRLHAQNEFNSQQSSVDTSDLELCNKLYRNSIAHYQQLARRLPPQFKWMPQLPTHQLVNMRPEACGQTDTTAIFQKALSLHSSKIGILLPLSRWPQPVRVAVMEQVQNLARSLGWDPAKSLVWMDTDGSRDRLETQLAQLVYVHHVGLVIGGLTTQEAPHLARWADQLRLPTIVLNRRFDHLRSKYVFYMGPDLRLLASTMTRHVLSRGMQKIAVLMPQNSRDGQLIQHFQQQAQHLRLTIDGPHLYNPADYASIDALLRKLFRIDDPARGQEQLDLMTKMKELATEQGVPFDSSNVVLPPIIEVDGIFIADHFKNVRHLAKALAFYGVKKLPIFGIPKWRAIELIDPPDELLQGAVFVDYIGSYEKLPYKLKPPILQTEFFLSGADAGQVDLQILVSHAYYAAQQALRGPRIPRYGLHQRLSEAKPDGHPFFDTPRIFREDQLSYWPSFLFGVHERNLQLLQVWNPASSEVRAQARP